jgi:hypothetical protein
MSETHLAVVFCFFYKVVSLDSGAKELMAIVAKRARHAGV